MKKTNIILGDFFSLTKGRKRGFTLVEMVAVILVICILAAVAMPFYKRAMTKSRFHVAMANVKTIVQAQEVYYLSEGKYTSTVEDLDMSPREGESDIELTIQPDTESTKYEYVKAYHKNAPNVRYISFLAHSPNFANNIHCEAQKDDETAIWLCEEELQGQKLAHGSLDGSDFVTYILQGDAGDGTFAQTYVDNPTSPLTNGDSCIAEHAGGCSDTSFIESSCEGNQSAGCRNNVYNNSSCTGGAGGNNADTTVCGNSTYNNSECHGEDVNTGYVCGRSDYNHNSACYSNTHGGCGHSTFDDGSTCYAHGNTACQQSEFTDSACIVESGGGCHNNSTFSNSTCTVEAGGGCTGNTFTNGSVCRTRAGGTSSNRACGTGSTYDHSTCYNESGSYFGCGKGTYNNESSCYSSATSGGCGGGAKFDGGSKCYGNYSGACGSDTYTNHSVCYANVSGACNSNTYQTGSYCSGNFCPAGSPREDGTIRTAVGP